MKGVVFQLLESYVVGRHGVNVYEDLLACVEDQLVTKEPFVGPGTYPDEDLLVLVGRACEMLAVEPSVMLRDFGRYCFGGLVARFRWAVAGHTDFRSFLGQLQGTIHSEVSKLMPGARTPDFRFRWDDDRLHIEYRSARGLCALAEGLLEGGAAHFGGRIALAKGSCTHRGADHCSWVGTLHA